MDGDPGWRPELVLVPLHRHRHQVAVTIAGGDVGQHHRMQPARAADPLAAAVNDALALQILQQPLQGDAGVALDVEGAGDLTLANLAVLTADEGQQGLAVGQPVAALHRLRVLCHNRVLRSHPLDMGGWMRPCSHTGPARSAGLLSP